MPLYEDNRACTECGRTEVTRHTCPSCPCNFCKKEGHIADNCERLKRRKEKSSRPVGRFADGNPASGGPLSNPFSIAPRKNQLRLPPRHNADVAAGSGAVATGSVDGGGSRGPSSDSPGRDFSQRSSALDTILSLKRKMEPESENARKKSTTTPTTLTPDVSPLLDAEIVRLGCVSTVFPELEPLAVYILEKISSEECPGNLKHYQKLIDQYGGTRKVLADMIAAVDLQFRSLQGQQATLEALRDIQRNQASNEYLWDAEGGYLDYITDTRNAVYFRLYVGQATDLIPRVTTHVQKMASGDMSTLHYYVKSMGGKYRQANFLRAFHIPDSVTSHADRSLIKSLLELEMCVALRTLPQGELVQWLPPGDREVKFPSVHLNVANPLLQGSSASASGRQSSRVLLLDSVDPEVRHWPDVRNRQLASKPMQSAAKSPYVPLAAYAPIFNQGIKANAGKLGELEPFNSDLEVSFDENFWESGVLQNCEDAISQYLGREVPLVRPLGSLASRMAIVLSEVETGKRSMVSSSPNNHDEVVPYGIREMGLNAGNILMWPFNLRQSRISRPDEMSTEVATAEAAYFRDYSLSLIAASSARFILICGEMGQRYLFDEAQGLSSPIEIILSGYNVVFRLMLDGTHIKRVFVVIPDPRKIMRGGDWRSSQKFAQIMRLATTLTKIDAIDHNFFENNRACSCIFNAIAEEKAFGTPLTIEQLGSGTRQWLARKGFQTNEDIEELTKLVGSLTEGLFVLLCSLPHNSYRVVRRGRPRKEKILKGPKYSKELLTAVRKLQQGKVQKNFFCPDLEEDGHDKVPVVARINVSRQSSYQPTDSREGLEDRDDESEDNPESSSDEPASIMEISLDIADESKIVITEAYDLIDSQQLDDSEVKGSGLQKPWRGWKFYHEARRAAYIDKVLDGGSFKPRKQTRHNAPKVNFAKIIISIRAGWELRPDTDVKIMVELAEAGSDHRKRYATHTRASAMARRLAFRLSGITLGGETFMVWPSSKSLKQAEAADELAKDVESS